MPKPIQVGASAVALAREYGLKGKLPLQLDETIVPVHVMGTIGGDEGTPAWGTWTIAAGGAGVRSSVGLENPATSGLLVRLDAFRATVDPTCAWQVTREFIAPLVAPTNTNSGFTRHGRDFGRAAGALLIDRWGVGVPGDGPVLNTGVVIGAPTTMALDEIIDACPVWLLPGQRIWFSPLSDNFGIRENLVWTEFPLDPAQE